MTKKIAEKVIIAKKEAVYGTDIVPIGANAMLTKDFQVTPFNGQLITRDNDRPNLGGSQRIRVGDYGMMNFKIEVAGSGTVDTPPPYAELLLACGMAETVNIATDVLYELTSVDGDSLTIVYNLDGIEQRFVGCRGAVGLELAPGGLPMWSFSFAGLSVPPTDTAAAVPVYTGFQLPLPSEKVNTPTFTLDAYAAVMAKFSLNPGQKVEYKNRVNFEGVFITDRDYVGSCTIHAPTLAAKNFYSICEASTLFATQLIHGTVGGNIIQLDAAQTQVTNVREDADGDIAALTLDLAFTASDAGDDDLTITTK